ncbi:DUF2778 domain-containing protein [Hyphomonas sp.]|uniref:DUF2778 domain-containing protein n=1 Tax=Hyphomonas sp. TaxID=87 RepID=UPI00391B886C
MALEIDTLDKAFPSQKPTRSQKRPSRFGFAGKMILGTAALGGIWIFAATTTISSFAPSHSALEKPRFNLALSLKPAHAATTSHQQADEPLSLRINKFSRLYQQPAAPKAARLEGAHLAAVLAQRPHDLALTETLGAAFAAVAEDEKFQVLAEARPEADVVRQMLDEAMNQMVALAPRVGLQAETVVTASIPTAPVADGVLSDEGAVELASLDVEEAPAPADLPASASSDAPDDAASEMAALAQDLLPAEGPLPSTRPQTAAKALEALAAAELTKPGKPARATAAPEEPAATVLAYARPDNPVKPIAPVAPIPNPGTKKVAIYDITNGVVHMPNGTKLEAHSGIGKMRDNPKYTHVKMKGPTPPGTYKLSMREKPFHGVAAIRLTSVDGKHPQGRTGLLAHTYLLRSNPGDSHGCVAFKHYDKFLAAFRRGEITHMVIVPEYNGRLPGQSNNLLVKLFGGKGA